MKLTINGLCIQPVLASMQLEKRRGDAAAALTATLWTAAADTYFLHLSLQLGDVVHLTDADGTERFLGSIHAIDRTPDAVTITALDRGVYLSRNQIYGVFAGDGAAICRQVAAQLGIGTGTLETGTDYQVLSAIRGASAISILRQAAGDDREISVENRLLTVRAEQNTTFLLPSEHIQEISAQADLQSAVDRCVVVDRKGTPLAQAENSGDIAVWGIFQAVTVERGGDAAAQAKAGLSRRRMKARVVLPGNTGYFCGASIRGQQPQWGLEGLYRIEAVCHSWEAGLFTTELTLAGQ